MQPKIKKSSYPGIDNVKTKLVSRYLHSSKSGLRIGSGFMHKAGKSVDEKNFITPQYALVYVIRGKGEYVLPDGQRFILSPGTLFQRHPGIEHSTFLDPNSQWAECFLDFGESLYDTLSECQIIQKNDYVYKMVPDNGIETEMYTLCRRLEDATPQELPVLIADMISFFSRIMQLCTAITEREIDREIGKISVDFGQDLKRRIDMRQYCKDKGLGYENFRKLFREKIGLSPGKYIIRRRLDAACQMLLVLDKTIGEISMDLGYKSQHEFSAQFKKVIGISPKSYRVGNFSSKN